MNSRVSHLQDTKICAVTLSFQRYDVRPNSRNSGQGVTKVREAIECCFLDLVGLSYRI